MASVAANSGLVFAQVESRIAALTTANTIDISTQFSRGLFEGWLKFTLSVYFVLIGVGVIAADAPPVKRVLMLFSEGKDLPVNVMLERAAKAELQSHSTNRIEFYAEHLDAMRFPGESYYRLFRAYFSRKYFRNNL